MVFLIMLNHTDFDDFDTQRHCEEFWEAEPTEAEIQAMMSESEWEAEPTEAEIQAMMSESEWEAIDLFTCERFSCDDVWCHRSPGRIHVIS